MALQMESLGTQRRSFVLKAPPSVLFRSNARRSALRTAIIPVFDPYEENLPLQSGYYSFVIDEDGDFRVKMGNTSSHGAMVGNLAAGAAGNFRINKAGRLAEVFCVSNDYRIRYSGPDDRVVLYVIRSFIEHPAFDVSDHVVFRFRRDLADILDLDYHGNPLDLDGYRNKLRLLDLDGNGGDVDIAFTESQINDFAAYRPEPPPRLYPMHRDQLIIAIEEGDDERFEFGPPESAYSIENGVISTGKNNFVIDAEGRLVVGIKGHHILSGGTDVGGAGHLKIEESGEVSELQLNFSGHYRPPLSIEYCRYVFRTITGHPLLVMKPGYLIQGRIFDESTGTSVVIRCDPKDLITENDITDEHIERLLI
jgi:hypothetical protein